MTTVIERVAEAQYAVLCAEADGRLPAWAGLDDHARDLMVKQVRAGLEALHHPPAAICNRAADPYEPGRSERDCLLTWNAMLDAILQEAP